MNERQRVDNEAKWQIKNMNGGKARDRRLFKQRLKRKVSVNLICGI